MTRRIFMVILVIAACLLAWSIVAALNAENIFDAGSRLAAQPWGRVTLIDLYLGFVCVGGLIVWRERRAMRWLPWLVALLLLGNLATALYLVRWLGSKAPEA